MKVTTELLDRFFNKQCTAAEAEQVAAYLKDHPAELDRYLPASEWDDTGSVPSLPKDLQHEMWQNIQHGNKSASRLAWLRRSVAAAAMIGVILFTYNKVIKTDKQAGTDNVATNIPVPVSSGQQVIHNHSQKVMNVALPDGSEIQLSPGSQVRYDPVFHDHKRLVFLEGEAFFRVAKDKTRPFTVYTGSLTTTALGTTFRIITHKEISGRMNDIHVKLFTGKVVVRSMGNVKGWEKDVYMMPGQQLWYNTADRVVSVDKILNSPPRLKAGQHSNKGTEPAGNIANRLNFDGSDLSDVLDQLSAYFSVKIGYDRDEIKGLNFTGDISRKDAVAAVLKIIAQMNNLEVVQTGETFELHKIKGN